MSGRVNRCFLDKPTRGRQKIAELVLASNSASPNSRRFVQRMSCEPLFTARMSGSAGCRHWMGRQRWLIRLGSDQWCRINVEASLSCRPPSVPASTHVRIRPDHRGPSTSTGHERTMSGGEIRPCILQGTKPPPRLATSSKTFSRSRPE